MKVRITRTDLESKPREYTIRGNDLAIVAAQALERLRADELHAISVVNNGDGTASISTRPATYTVEKL